MESSYTILIGKGIDDAEIAALREVCKMVHGKQVGWVTILKALNHKTATAPEPAPATKQQEAPTPQEQAPKAKEEQTPPVEEPTATQRLEMACAAQYKGDPKAFPEALRFINEFAKRIGKPAGVVIAHAVKEWSGFVRDFNEWRAAHEPEQKPQQVEPKPVPVVTKPDETVKTRSEFDPADPGGEHGPSWVQIRSSANYEKFILDNVAFFEDPANIQLYFKAKEKWNKKAFFGSGSENCKSFPVKNKKVANENGVAGETPPKAAPPPFMGHRMSPEGPPMEAAPPAKESDAKAEFENMLITHRLSESERAIAAEYVANEAKLGQSTEDKVIAYALNRQGAFINDLLAYARLKARQEMLPGSPLAVNGHKDSSWLLGIHPPERGEDLKGDVLDGIMRACIRAELLWPDIAKTVGQDSGFNVGIIRAMDDASKYDAAYEYLAEILQRGVKAGRKPKSLIPTTNLADDPQPHQEDMFSKM